MVNKLFCNIFIQLANITSQELHRRIQSDIILIRTNL